MTMRTLADATNDTFRFAPGQLYNLNVSITDDVGVPCRMVLFTNDSVVNVTESSTFVSNQVHGSPGKEFQSSFQTITNRVLSFSLNTRCPPFYLYAYNTNSVCRCSVYDRNQKYPFCKFAGISPATLLGWVHQKQRCSSNIKLSS